MMQNAHGKVMCSIQVTSANGALCVINPLYLQEHGDDWLTQSPNSSRERRLSTMQPWGAVALNPKQSISLDQDCCSVSFEVTESARGLSFDSALPLIHPQSPQPPQPTNLTQSPPPPLPPKSKHYHPYPQSPNSPQPTNLSQSPQPPLPPKSKHCHPSPQSPNSPQHTLPPSPLHKEVVLRRTSQEPPSLPRSRVGSQPNPWAPRSPGPSPVPRPLSSPAPQSPHRVSWVEEGAWFPSQLQPCSMRPVSLSVSSLEEEPDTVSSPTHYHPSSHRFAEKVKNRFSAMGQAIGGLLCLQTKITYRVQELSERRVGRFAKAVKGFVEQTQRGMVMPGITGAELLQEVRASLTALREKLLDCQEMMTLLDSMIDTPDSEIDIMVEISLHKVALKPVSSHLYSCLQQSRSQDGSLGRLLDNQGVLRGRRVEELEGAVGAGLPDIPTLGKIQQCWTSMHSAYSPNKKIDCLLKVCKTIYSSMNANASPGVVFGADDFLPCLTWVVLRSDVINLQLDTDYMMELLDPIQLQGQGGYYLTTLYASLFYISSFCPRLAVRQFSAEAQQSIKQWHRRRTLDCRESHLRKSRRTIHGSRQTWRGGTTSETTPGGMEGEVVVSLQEAPSRRITESREESLLAISDLSPLRKEGPEAEDQSGSGDVDTQAPPSTETPLEEEGHRQPMKKEYWVEQGQRAVEGGSDEPETWKGVVGGGCEQGQEG